MIYATKQVKVNEKKYKKIFYNKYNSVCYFVSMFIDALPAFEKFLALAIVVFVICIIFMKNTGKAVLASDVILFILTNFNVFLSKVDHVIGRKKIIVILFFIIFMFMILVKKKIRSEQNICMLIGIYFLVLIAMNFFVALPTICSKLNYQKVEN